MGTQKSRHKSDLNRSIFNTLTFQQSLQDMNLSPKHLQELKSQMIETADKEDFEHLSQLNKEIQNMFRNWKEEKVNFGCFKVNSAFIDNKKKI